MKSSPSGPLHSSHKPEDNSVLITKIYFNTYTILKISNSNSPQNFEIFFHRAERPKTMYKVQLHAPTKSRRARDIDGVNNNPVIVLVSTCIYL